MNRRKLIGLFLALLTANTGCSNSKSAKNQSESVFDFLEGTWGHNTEHKCKNNPHTISVSADRKLLLFKHQKDVTSYDGVEQNFYIYHILASGSNWIAVVLDGEKRKLSSGEPVIWRIYISGNKNRYTWWRYDWPNAVRAKQFGVRCKKEHL